MKEHQPTEEETALITLMQDEKSDWEEGQVWVIDKVAFVMKNVIKNARKNFYGIFDEEKDPITKRKKVFVPMTEWVVETILKNIDIDTKDIQVYAKSPAYSKAAFIFQHILKSVLDNTRFGITLNKALRNCVTDGTAVFKVWKEKKKLCIKTIDRLNILCDPTAPTLDDSAAILEHNVLTLPELREYEGDWENLDVVKGSNMINRTGVNQGGISMTNSQIPYVDVYERYGYVPKNIVTGNAEDSEDFVYALAVVSGLDSNPVVHKIKEVEGHPYQEIKFKDLINRFDGRGIPEMLFMIQAYVNEIVNIRLNNARTSQTNLWRVGGTVTPQQLKNLFVTGAIKAGQGEIENLSTGSVDPMSYKDEDTGYEWAQRVTQSQREDEVNSSKPATTSLIEERGANKAYNLVMEGIFMNLGKMIEEKVVPIIQEIISDKEVIMITGDPQALEELAEPFVRNHVRAMNEQAMQEMGTPLYQDPTQEDAMVQQLLKELGTNKGVRYIEYVKEAFNTDYAITVDPSNEEVNRGIMIQQLNQAASTLASIGVPASALKDVFQEMYDSMGLPGEKLASKIDAIQPTQSFDTSLQPNGAPTDAQAAPKPGNIAPTP